MLFEKTVSPRTTAAVALCLVLTSAPLVACSGQSSASEGEAPTATSQAAAVDISSWKTLGDAFAVRTDSLSSGWDEHYYVSVFKADDSIVRVVGKLDADSYAKIEAVDWSKEDAEKQLAEATDAVPLVIADDLTSELVSQDELDKYVGKKGEDLIDDGWTFQSYYMTGGDQTGTYFAKGDLVYMITFDISVSDDVDDEGASVMDATVAEAEFGGASDAATDPSQVN
ncbi:MAG: hypothetical protein IKG18_18820 [Atopobiaceae bacterium]|nr:hypothetical protein [Atopobiaceae bacterium]MBR3316179.1 hypothetical protein [Atopobiaceae bacterium]